MIALYCTLKAVSDTTKVLFAFPCTFKKIHMYGGQHVILYDAKAIGDVVPGTTRVIAEFRGTNSAPHDHLDCTENEVIRALVGVTAVGVGADATTSLRFYSMGNPVGSQGSV